MKKLMRREDELSISFVIMNKVVKPGGQIPVYPLSKTLPLPLRVHRSVFKRGKRVKTDVGRR
jgi:hypothetical protein